MHIFGQRTRSVGRGEGKAIEIFEKCSKSFAKIYVYHESFSKAIHHDEIFWMRMWATIPQLFRPLPVYT